MSRFYYDLGTREYAAGRYERALQEFFDAQRLSPSPRTVYNVGLCFLQLHRDEDAFLFLAEYLAGEDDATGAAGRRAFAERTLHQLEGRVARVRVDSSPPGARIFVDQAEHGVWGTTPRVLALPAGRHRVWVELDGFRRAEVEVVARRGRSVRAQLAPERIRGRVEVESSVPGHVRVLASSGVAVAEGDTPFGEALLPGDYRLELVAPGHRPFSRAVRIVADATSHVDAEPEPRPPSRSSLTVTADVENAVVEIDGLPAGFTPLAAPGLSVRTHRLAVTAPGRVAWEGTVTTTAARQTWVRVHLAEIPRTRGGLIWGLGSFAAALLAGGAIAGVAALRARDRFQHRLGSLAQGDLRGLRQRGRRLGFSADALLGAGVLLAGATLLLRFSFGGAGTHTSSADVSEGAR
ncbi:MAG: PEGA domain-containing protein [Deltaproteobacteria bacterium]|nr:PEGA domain-containing protein [Deltaproteobacteria bacterium]